MTQIYACQRRRREHPRCPCRHSCATRRRTARAWVRVSRAAESTIEKRHSPPCRADESSPLQCSLRSGRSTRRVSLGRSARSYLRVNPGKIRQRTLPCATLSGSRAGCHAQILRPFCLQTELCVAPRRGGNVSRDPSERSRGHHFQRHERLSRARVSSS